MITKFNVGQFVYAFEDENVISFIISSIIINNNGIFYLAEDDEITSVFNEKNIFLSMNQLENLNIPEYIFWR